MLVGPIPYLMHYDQSGKFICYSPDWSRPGVKERIEAEISEMINSTIGYYKTKLN